MTKTLLIIAGLACAVITACLPLGMAAGCGKSEPAPLTPSPTPNTRASRPAKVATAEAVPAKPTTNPDLPENTAITPNALVEITVPVTLPTPTQLSIREEGGALVLCWHNHAPNDQWYTIERKSGEFSQFEPINTVYYGNITQTDLSCTLSHWRFPWAFASNTDYFFRVKAHADHVTSPYSEEVKWSSPLAAPSNLAVTGTDLSNVVITWQDNSQTEGGFIIERRSYFEDFRPVVNACPNATSGIDTTIDFATPYVYRVKAFRFGKESAYTDEQLGTNYEYEHIISQSAVWVFTSKTTPSHTAVISAGRPVPVISSAYNAPLRIQPRYDAFNSPIYRRPTEEMLSAARAQGLQLDWLAEAEITEARLESLYLTTGCSKYHDVRYHFSCGYMTWVYRQPFDSQGNALQGGITYAGAANQPDKITLKGYQDLRDKSLKPGQYYITIQ